MSKQTKWKAVLENIKLVADTLGSLAPIVKAILVGLSMLCLSLFISDLKTKSEADKLAEDVRKYKENVKMAVQFAENTKLELDKYKASIAQAEKANVTLTKKINTLAVQTTSAKKQVDSLKVLLHDTTKTQSLRDTNIILAAIVLKQDTIIKKQDTTINKQAEKITNLEQISLKKDTINNKLLFALDSVSKVAVDIPNADKCYDKILFCKVNKPTRKTTFIAGVITGIIATGFILR